ncbi:Ferric reductase like transmembrane component family protein [Coccidioides posadasii C735 delta SOWgp]|uniref:ferric-chelate reductase (NADPH) n=2 Tax=Coccidioides posadasii TaxID=199306 RepID=C5P9F9_COCP7|nr:Ferric reductase like transmembrane component family protein [Coccidioides posadasii C735 delta SOWgp]EER26371.1 Ferric reductase like transmembrane component family protein [Coccidioides posadasii C735 delta SOWgp]|eukprot:XP_003068516.1 Ferric reductase like transmembrane component family protein [Coccidioides posadasii C735 delta SOWgp]
MFIQLLLLLPSTIVGANQHHNPSFSNYESVLSLRGTSGGRGHTDTTNISIVSNEFGRSMLYAGLGLLLFFLTWTVGLRISAHVRHLANLNNGTQNHFVPSGMYWAWLKRHVIYAPMFRVRHNREIRLSSAINFGTLPTRFQAALLMGIFAMNITLCCVAVPYGSTEEDLLTTIQIRSGILAVVNLPPLVFMAARNNALIKLLGVSFDTWNLLHRWLGRIVAFESFIHVIAYMVKKVHTWTRPLRFKNYQLINTEAVSILAMILIHSPSPIRHAFYETFLHFHIVFVAAFLGFLWIHLENQPQQPYVPSVVGIWAIENQRAVRWIRAAYLSLGKGGTTATVEVLPGDAMRITLRIVRPWVFKPGQHLYLYLPAVGLWMSHPFTAAWSDTEEVPLDNGVLVRTKQDVLKLQRANISLVVRRRTGLTNRLYNRTCRATDGRLTFRAMVEGPYGTEHSLDSYGTVILIAGGVGITHLISYVRHLVAGFSKGTVAARRVTLVWIIQSPDHLEWVKPWMTSILSMERRREVLRVMLFITRPRNMKEIQSPSTKVQMFPGKPDIERLLDGEVENQVGAMGVLVCGTGSLSDDVRKACRERQSPTHIDFIEECFTW